MNSKSDIFTSDQFTSDTIYIFTVVKNEYSRHKYIQKSLINKMSVRNYALCRRRHTLCWRIDVLVKMLIF